MTGSGSGIGWWKDLFSNASSNSTSPWTPVVLPPSSPSFTATSILLSNDPLQTRVFAVGGYSVAAFRRRPPDCGLTFVGMLPMQALVPNGIQGLVSFVDAKRFLGGTSSGTGRNMILSSFEMTGGVLDSDGSGFIINDTLTFRGFLPTPPITTLRSMPALSPDEQHVYIHAAGGEMSTARLDTLNAQISMDYKVAWAPDATYEVIQTGYYTDQAFAVASADNRFLYSTGAVTDLYRFALDPTTGHRIDGGRRFTSNDSMNVQHSNLVPLKSWTSFTSMAFSADSEQSFVYGAGKVLHSLQRNSSTGELFQRRVFSIIPQATSGLFGTPVMRADPFPHMLIPDGKQLLRFRTNLTTGELLLPVPGVDPTRGAVFSLPTESVDTLSTISALAVDSSTIYIGAGTRSIFVQARSPSTGAITNATRIQLLRDTTKSTQVVAFILTPLFLYSFDTGGVLIVHARAADGYLQQLQTAPPALGTAASTFTSAVVLWTNGIQSVVVAGLATGELVLYRRNVLTGLLDTPTVLTPPGLASNAFVSQGKPLSLTATAATLMLTTTGAGTYIAAQLLELETGNIVLTSDGSNNGSTIDNNIAPIVDWLPAMRLQFRLAGSPYDGQWISFRPSLQSNMQIVSTARICATLPVPARVQDIFVSTPDACSVTVVDGHAVTTPCVTISATMGGCSVAQKVKQLLLISRESCIHTSPTYTHTLKRRVAAC